MDDGMSVKPILFNTDMVRAILDGHKTVTRRVVKFPKNRNPQWSGYIPDGAVLYGSNNIPAAKSPYRPGDVLWVRETWAHMPREAARIWLRVTDVRVERLQTEFFKQESAIFDLRAEGIDIGETCRECISTYGRPCCIDEDPEYGSECGMLDDVRDDFACLWDGTVKPADRDRYGWAANPWVWVIKFERCEKPKEG